jgi:hypothetical protein
MRRAHTKSKPYVNRKGPTSRGVADARLESAITHPFNVMRHLDPRDHKTFLKIQGEILRNAPDRGVYYRQLGRAGVTLLSRATINKAAEWSPVIKEIPTEVLKANLRDMLPTSSRRIMANGRIIGATVLGSELNGYSLGLALSTRHCIAREHEPLVEYLNTLGALELNPSANVAHVSVARFVGETLSEEVMEDQKTHLEKYLTHLPHRYLSLLPVRFVDQSQQFFDPQQD